MSPNGIYFSPNVPLYDFEAKVYTRFPSSPLIIRVPFFLLFGFNKGAQKEKGQKGTTGGPSILGHMEPWGRSVTVEGTSWGSYQSI